MRMSIKLVSTHFLINQFICILSKTERLKFVTFLYLTALKIDLVQLFYCDNTKMSVLGFESEFFCRNGTQITTNKPANQLITEKVY